MPKEMKMVLLFDLYGTLLSEHQREIFDVYYNDDLSLSEIAENFGITRQGVLNNVRTAEKMLSEFEASLGLAEKFRKNSNLAEKISVLAQDIAKGKGNARDNALKISELISKFSI